MEGCKKFAIVMGAGGLGQEIRQYFAGTMEGESVQFAGFLDGALNNPKHSQMGLASPIFGDVRSHASSTKSRYPMTIIGDPQPAPRWYVHSSPRAQSPFSPYAIHATMSHATPQWPTAASLHHSHRREPEQRPSPSATFTFWAPHRMLRSLAYSLPSHLTPRPVDRASRTNAPFYRSAPIVGHVDGCNRDIPFLKSLRGAKADTTIPHTAAAETAHIFFDDPVLDHVITSRQSRRGNPLRPR